MTQDELREVLQRDVVTGAQALLGAVLVHGSLRARIIETEAYGSSDDPASHAFRGKTPRNGVMFGPPGFAYVYFNYGVHWMLNVSAHGVGDAAGVLIRAAVPLEGLETMRDRRGACAERLLLAGPGRLTRAFGIGREHMGVDLLHLAQPLHIVAASSGVEFVSGPRVGISLGKGDGTPWRFVERDWVSWASKGPQQSS